MTSAEELVRRYVGVIDGSEDAAAVVEFVHPDFLDHVSGQRGTDIFAVVQRWGSETFADVAVEVHAVMTNADLVSIWFTTEATHIGNAFPMREPGQLGSASPGRPPNCRAMARCRSTVRATWSLSRVVPGMPPSRSSWSARRRCSRCACSRQARQVTLAGSAEVDA